MSEPGSSRGGGGGRGRRPPRRSIINNSNNQASSHHNNNRTRQRGGGGGSGAGAGGGFYFDFEQNPGRGEYHQHNEQQQEGANYQRNPHRLEGRNLVPDLMNLHLDDQRPGNQPESNHGANNNAGNRRPRNNNHNNGQNSRPRYNERQRNDVPAQDDRTERNDNTYNTYEQRRDGGGSDRRRGSDRSNSNSNGGSASNSGIGGSGSIGRPAKPGDWTCLINGCGQSNFANRTQCFKCSEARPEGVGVAGSTGGETRPPIESRAGNWTCPEPNCNFDNYASRSECYKCGAKNPSGGNNNRGHRTGKSNRGNGAGSRQQHKANNSNAGDSDTESVSSYKSQDSTNKRSNGTNNKRSVEQPQQKQEQNSPLSLDKLKALLQADSSFVLENLNKHIVEWEKLFNTKLNDVNSDVVLLFILGSKICQANNSAAENPQESSSSSMLISKTLTPHYSSRLQEIFKNLDSGSAGLTLAHAHEYLDFAAQTNPIVSAEFLKGLLPVILKRISELKKMKPLAVEAEAQNDEEVQDQDPEDECLSTSLDELEISFSCLNDAVRAVLGDTPAMCTTKDIHEGPSKSAEAAAAANNGSSSSLHKKQSRHAQKLKEKMSYFYFSPKEEELLHKMNPPDHFRDISIIPSVDEILDPQESFLRPNKASGAYRDAEHYLDVQFRLFREDFLRPLKKGIQEFMSKKHDYLSRRKRLPFGTVRLYQKVRILSAELIRDIMTYTIQLDTDLTKRIKWDKCRRLLNGSLLLFTLNGPSECFNSPECFNVSMFNVSMFNHHHHHQNVSMFCLFWCGCPT